MPEEDKNQPGAGDLNNKNDLTGTQEDNNAVPVTSSVPTVSTSATMGTGYQAAQNKDVASQGSAAGSRFRNLKNYIDRNKSNLAGRIGSGLQRQEAQIGQQLGQARTGFETVAGQEEVRLSEAQKQFGDQTQARQNIAQNAVQLAQDPTKLQQFQQLRQGQVADTSIQGKEDIAKGLEKIQDQAQRLGSEQGRFQALRESLGAGRQYSQGASKLDQLLLQTKTDELNKLKDLRQNVGVTARSEFQDLLGKQTAKQAELGGLASTLKENVQVGLGQETGEMTQATKDLLAQKRAEDIAKENEFRTRLAQGRFTLPEMMALGIEAGEGLYGIKDPTKYVTPGEATESSIMTPEQAQKYQALLTLGGVTPGAGNADYLNINPELAGTYKGTQSGIDKLAEDIRSQKERYLTELKPLDETKAINERFVAERDLFSTLAGKYNKQGDSRIITDLAQKMSPAEFDNMLRNAGLNKEDFLNKYGKYELSQSGWDNQTITGLRDPSIQDPIEAYKQRIEWGSRETDQKRKEMQDAINSITALRDKYQLNTGTKAQLYDPEQEKLRQELEARNY